MSPIARPLAITIDCHNPRSLLLFWQKLVGGDFVTDSPDDYLVLKDVPTLGMMGFQKVPEAKQVKNRVHLDLDVPDIEEAVERSTRIGATRHGIVHEEPANFFQVMSDPEGNEFCFILLK
jgi:predicted enzyme related to lactoylglutathione lyase